MRTALRIRKREAQSRAPRAGGVVAALKGLRFIVTKAQDLRQIIGRHPGILIC